MIRLGKLFVYIGLRLMYTKPQRVELTTRLNRALDIQHELDALKHRYIDFPHDMGEADKPTIH